MLNAFIILSNDCLALEMIKGYRYKEKTLSILTNGKSF